VLFSGSVADNIRYAKPQASDEEVQEAARIANAHDFINAFPDGYNTAVGPRGLQLSGGQRQRVAIARAVLKDAPILVLDEASSALDASSEHAVQEALARVMPGRTVISIAHRLSTMRHCDSIAVLGEGGVVEQGSFEELRTTPGSAFAELMKRQLFVDKEVVAEAATPERSDEPS
jgi:ATP-binding cassette subfamily B protein